MKKLLPVFLIFLIPVILYFSGPRIDINTDFSKPEISGILAEYVSNSENKYSDIRPGTEKKILWAGNAGEKTEYSIIYLHGFTASRMETEPVTSIAASALGANVFYTRLKGHGHYQLNSQNDIKLSDWLYDTYEALEIGRQIGEKIIVLSCSSGSALGAWICDNYPETIEAVIMISPNFKPADSRFRLISRRWGTVLAKLVEGDVVGENEIIVSPEHAAGWSYIYKTEMLFSLAALLETVDKIDYQTIDIPIQVFYSLNDTVVDHEKTYEIFEIWNTDDKKMIRVENPGDKNNHIIAGDIFSPETTDFVVSEIISFISSLE